MSRTHVPANQQILEEACNWFVTLRSQDLSEITRENFQDWLKRSPEHIRAYLEIASIYADIPAPEQGHTPPELIARAKASSDVNVVILRAGASPVIPAQAGTHSHGHARRSTSLSASELSLPLLPVSGEGAESSRRMRVPAIAATLILLVGIAAWFSVQRGVYSTDIGEQRSITMADGSIIELNARSKVRVALGDQQRDVELLEGQALFRVAKDPSRPFTVHAGTTSVRAVGTQFDVNRRSTGTTVTVLEGRVAVKSSPPGSLSPNVKSGSISADSDAGADEASSEIAGSRSARERLSAQSLPSPRDSTGRESPQRLRGVGPHELLLAAGEQATVSQAGSVRLKSQANLAAATAWTQHQLVFDGTPLSEVLEEFSRYTSRRVVVDTTALGKLKISGQYTSASPDSLLRFLSLQEGIVITEVNGETHIAQRRP